ncbi:TetR/AcrR family transcriptional regulator [Paenibacillus senegalimassiliensis]|uniref:TetR/AcrR family transcriptional regulator n=1 Tax=Paenibacillus senegalimassiliensis TaxID=1737426 RepID=UPI00073EEB2D|nr:TetR/AcrR family transcriptional regulator [Paenibacillus senegalimassiliensis]
MRVSKEAEVRKNEILDAADQLFGQKGFDGTSTNDILQQVGIARGTLYYHFKSKEDIMDALIERYSDRLFTVAREVAADQRVAVYERITRVILALNLSGPSDKQIMEHIHKPQNARMHQKIQKAILQGLTPILADLIREGIQQGLFRTPYPYECMEMVVAYANTVFDEDMVELNEEERATRIQALVFNLERLLGADSGSLASFVMRMFENGSEDGK